MLGLVAVDVVPSPKFQLRDAMLPSLSVDESVNVADRPLVVKVKLAVGATLPGGVPPNKECSIRLTEPVPGLVTLPSVEDLTDAIERIASFLEARRVA